MLALGWAPPPFSILKNEHWGVTMQFWRWRSRCMPMWISSSSLLSLILSTETPLTARKKSSFIPPECVTVLSHQRRCMVSHKLNSCSKQTLDSADLCLGRWRLLQSFLPPEAHRDRRFAAALLAYFGLFQDGKKSNDRVHSAWAAQDVWVYRILLLSLQVIWRHCSL